MLLRYPPYCRFSDELIGEKKTYNIEFCNEVHTVHRHKDLPPSEQPYNAASWKAKMEETDENDNLIHHGSCKDYHKVLINYRPYVGEVEESRDILRTGPNEGIGLMEDKKFMTVYQHSQTVRNSGEADINKPLLLYKDYAIAFKVYKRLSGLQDAEQIVKNLAQIFCFNQSSMKLVYLTKKQDYIDDKEAAEEYQRNEFKALESRVEGVEKTQATHEERFKRIEDEKNALVARFNQFESDQNAREAYEKSLNEMVANIKAEIKAEMQAGMQKMQEAHQQEMSQLETQMNELGGRVDGATKEASDAMNRANQVNETVSNVATRADAAMTAATTADEKAARAEGKAEKATEDAGKALETANATAAKVEHLIVDLDALKVEIDTERTEVRNLISNWQSATSKEVAESVKKMNGRMDMLLCLAQRTLEKATAVGNKKSTLEKSLNDLHGKVKKLQSQFEDSRAEVSLQKFNQICKLQDDLKELATKVTGSKAEADQVRAWQTDVENRINNASRNINYLLAGGNQLMEAETDSEDELQPVLDDPNDPVLDDPNDDDTGGGNALCDEDQLLGKTGYRPGRSECFLIAFALFFLTFMGSKEPFDMMWVATVGEILLSLVVACVLHIKFSYEAKGLD